MRQERQPSAKTRMAPQSGQPMPVDTGAASAGVATSAPGTTPIAVGVRDRRVGRGTRDRSEDLSLRDVDAPAGGSSLLRGDTESDEDPAVAFCRDNDARVFAATRVLGAGCLLAAASAGAGGEKRSSSQRKM